MKVSDAEKFEIEDMNQTLRRINYKCHGLDNANVELFHEMVDINLAKHMAAQQVSPQSIPIANVKINGEPIIPIEQTIVTLFDISSFYGVRVDYLISEYEKCNFDQTSQEFSELIMNLRQYNRTCKMLSDEIPVPKISSFPFETFKRANTFTLKAKTLAEIANSNNIPFVRLYEAFLRYEDITVALTEIKKADLERKMISKYNEVVDLSMGGDILAYKAYFSYLKEREYISRKIYSNNNETTDGIYLTEEEFEKLLLIDARRFDDMQFLITPEERNFIQTLRNRIVHGELSLTNYEIFNLLSILSTHRLTVHENTQLFMKLVENDNKKGLTDSCEDILQNGEDPFDVDNQNFSEPAKIR